MILQALKEYYDRKAADPDCGIAPLGWERKEIPFLLNLSASGELIRIEDTREGKTAKPFLVPTLGESKGNGVKSNFPWENAEYIFGISLKVDKNNAVPKRKEEFLARLNGYAEEDWAKTIITFLQHVDVDRIAAAHKSEWGQILKGAYMLFAINGVPVSNLDSFKHCYQLPVGYKCICLATGMRDNLKEKEPPIKGSGFFKITPTENIKSELHIVSFNEDAFTSFKKKQGQNAPIGQIASFAYTTALNTLLAKNSRQKIQVGDTTAVFWSERKTTLEDEFIDMFGEPEKDNPDKGVAAVERLLASVRTGSFAHEDETTRFYVLGLAPNAARISVRFWHNGTVAEMERCFANWFENLRIAHGPRDKEHLSLWRLLVSIAPLGKSENIPPNLAGAVMRSILEGTPYPATLLSSAILRIKAEHEVTYPRAKLIKAFINHNLKNERKLTVSLDKENTNVGYRLGRLFAVLEKIQEEANPGLNATIRDKFYASASSTPSAVYGNLMRLKNHHLGKLAQGRAIYFEKLLGEVVSEVPAFPAHLSLDEQGQFAIGYYHQRQDFFTAKRDKADDSAGETSENANRVSQTALSL